MWTRWNRSSITTADAHRTEPCVLSVVVYLQNNFFKSKCLDFHYRDCDHDRQSQQFSFWAWISWWCEWRYECRLIEWSVWLCLRLMRSINEINAVSYVNISFVATKNAVRRMVASIVPLDNRCIDSAQISFADSHRSSTPTLFTDSPIKFHE